MNTIDIEYNNNIKSFNELYELAMKQFVDYEKLEGINWSDYDFCIDCADDQARFKDMLQIRFIEELTEASASLPEPDEHFWEEIGDAINFFLSAMCMYGLDFKSMPEPELYTGNYSKRKPYDLYSFSLRAYPVVHAVGYLCNLLKNRPWAQSNYLVSMLDFEERLTNLWLQFFKFLKDMHVTKEDVFEMVYRKYMVNQHRISTGY